MLRTLTQSSRHLPAQHVKRALIVDNDPRVCLDLAFMLDGLAIDTQSCLPDDIPEIIEVFDPHLILLDVQLGSCDAFTVVRSVIPITYKGVISVISGLGLDTVLDVILSGEKRGLRLGAPLFKPVALEDLRHIVVIADEMTKVGLQPAAERLIKNHSPQQSCPNLEQALDDGLLELWYQPKFDVATMRVSGAEALIRARTHEGRLVQPGELLVGAARKELIRLTDFVVERAIDDIAYLSSVGFKHPISVNVPISYLLQPDPPRLLRRAAAQPEWPGMIFEVTEDEALNDIAEVELVASQLKLYDVSLSIDDFGAGYSSLARLRDIPFSELKLDRSFVHGCATNSMKQSICRNVLALGQELGVATVAEGVEDEADLGVCLRLGCTHLQGFRFALPMPSSEFRDFVQGRLKLA